MNNPAVIQTRRIYEKPSSTDGYRVLVDRLWPRGLSKDKASLDLWLKEIAPSTSLRKWFNHNPDKFEEFKDRYVQELKSNTDTCNLLLDKAYNHTITLLYAARNKTCNHAIVLQEFLSSRVNTSS
jgi:uncharacterized protein YeaO (DUF488 family)